MQDIAEKLRAARVAPVIRTSTEAAARHGVKLLAEQGFTLFEITLTTPGALSIIADLAREPAFCIGAGTVLDLTMAEKVIDAGAAFVVSPVAVPGLVAATHKAGVAAAMGAATPAEIWQAHQDGSDFVKIFPARQLGGPAYLKAVKSVFPDIALMPTGGVEPGEMNSYFQAGAACLGMGGKLVNDAALQAGDDEAIRTAAREVRAGLEK